MTPVGKPHLALIQDRLEHLEYEDNADRLSDFFSGLVQAAPQLQAMHQRLVQYCQSAYGIPPAPLSRA